MDVKHMPYPNASLRDQINISDIAASLYTENVVNRAIWMKRWDFASFAGITNVRFRPAPSSRTKTLQVNFTKAERVSHESSLRWPRRQQRVGAQLFIIDPSLFSDALARNVMLFHYWGRSDELCLLPRGTGHSVGRGPAWNHSRMTWSEKLGCQSKVGIKQRETLELYDGRTHHWKKPGRPGQEKRNVGH